MKYIVKLVMDGSFPGSPDTFTYEVDGETYSIIRVICQRHEGNK